MSATHQAAVRVSRKTGRPPKPGKDRACLKCGAIFRSSGPGNRICPRCAKQNAELLIAAYMERLSEYPGDVVQYVLKTAADTHKFFPAWSELKEDLDSWSHERFKLADAMARHLATRQNRRSRSFL